MLNNDLNYVNVGIEIDVCTTPGKTVILERKKLNWIVSVLYGAIFTKFGTPVFEDDFEATVSQIIYLGPISF